jgi:hypothetical protein
MMKVISQMSLKTKILGITGIVLSLILLSWLILAAYVSMHKKQLLESITKQLNENLSGKLTIGSMEPALIRGFPGISVVLKNVLLRDSLWAKHHHNLVKAETVYIAIDAFSIPGGNPAIKNITINGGEIYLFTDSSGYSNTSLFKKGTNEKAKNNKHKKINRIILNDVDVTVENLKKNNLYKFSVKNFASKIHYDSSSWSAEVSLKTRVNSLAFKKQKGSFLRNKIVEATLDMNYNHKNHVLSIPVQQIKIGSDKIQAGGKFAFGEADHHFTLLVTADNILYNDAASMLPPAIESKLKRYGLKNAMALHATISGELQGGKQPVINVGWKVKNNTLTINKETLTNCSFSGSYTNEFKQGHGRTDSNSVVNFYGMNAKWRGIAFTSDTIHVINLIEPLLIGRFRSKFSLSQLNDITGGATFAFSGGTADLDVLYKAPYDQKNTSQPYFSGFIHISDADITYVPRDLTFKNTHLTINFSGSDVFFKDVKVKSGSSSLVMQGSVRNFMNLYYTDPKKILLNWNIQSPEINLSEFLSFLGKRKRGVSDPDKIGKIFYQLDRVLDEASVRMDVSVAHMKYKRFSATNIHSTITLKQSGISLENVGLSHAGGRLQLKGNIDQSGPNNLIDIESSISNVNVQELFNAFDNFGQAGITDKNIRGNLSAQTKVHASMQNNGQMVPHSFYGYVNFDLQQGSLINFAPMQKIGQFAFPNRNFSNITFSNLKNTLDLQGNKIIIRPMLIESSVLNLFVEGVYGIPSGTNIAMRIPLRNPKKDEFLEQGEKDKRILRGIVLNLKAVDGEDGNVRIKMGKADEESPRIEKKLLFR